MEDVAEGLGVPATLLHSWKKKFGDEVGIRHVRASETPEQAELRELRKKVRELEEEWTILKSRSLLRKAQLVDFEFVHAEKAFHDLRLLCRVLGISRSGYHSGRGRNRASGSSITRD